MTVRAAVYDGVSRLKTKVETPFLDAVILLCHARGISKERLFAAYPEDLADDVYSSYMTYIESRLNGQPVSYIRGKKEFYGTEFSVDDRVLVPRPDTEVLVEEAGEIIKANQNVHSLHDCCTGTGCIAVSLKLLYPEIDISASDISSSALEVFRKNCIEILGYVLPSVESDLLQNVESSFDIIVANPPYLTTAEVTGMKTSGWPEPAVALDGGPDGLSIIDRFIAECSSRLKTGGHLLLESASNQTDDIERKLVQFGFQNIIISRDLAGKERVISAQWIAS